MKVPSEHSKNYVLPLPILIEKGGLEIFDYKTALV